MQQRNKKWLKKWPLVQVAIQDLKCALNIVTSHRNQCQFVEMQTHGGAEQHRFIHQDFEAVRFVHEKHTTTSGNHHRRPPRRLQNTAPTFPFSSEYLV